MTPDRLRIDLTELAEEVTSVDLLDRTLRTSRRLGIQRAVATSAAAVVMLGAATGTAFALMQDDSPPPLRPGESPSVAVTPTAEPPTSSPTTPPASASTPTSAVPPRQLTASEVKNGRLHIPDWGTKTCPSGTFKFKDGSYTYRPAAESPGQFTMINDAPVFVDIDGDGSKEAVVLITCSPFAVNAQQVLTLRRGADGSIETVGQVTAVGPGDRHPNYSIVALRSKGTDGIEASWRRISGTFEAPRQWRGYRWVDGRFTQVSGPHEFPDVSKVNLTGRVASPPVLTKQADGTYQGRVTMTLQNSGSQAVAEPLLRLSLPAGVTTTNHTGVNQCTQVNKTPAVWHCTMDDIPAHGTRTVSFDLKYSGSGDPADGSVEIDTWQEDKAPLTLPYTPTLRDA